MSKTIDTLLDDLKALLEQGYTGNELEDVAERFGASMKELLIREVSGLGKREPFRLRMSAIGKPESQLWFDSRATEEERETFDASAKFKFMYGHVIEELALSLAELSGHTVERRQETVTLEGVDGHIDATIDGELVDVKSASSYGFDKFKDGTLPSDDSFGYIYQISGYAQAMGLPRAHFLAIDKTLGHMCLYTPPELYDARKRIIRLKETLASDTPPIPKCVIKTEKNGNKYLGTPCSYCPHKHKCNPGLRTFIYSTGPKFFTEIVSEPRVHEVKTEDVV